MKKRRHSRALALAAALAAVALLACSAPADPGLRPRNPAPAPLAELTWEQLSFAGHGGTQLYAQSWRPAGPAGPAAPRGVVVLHHGLADHSTRYAGLAEPLARAGYAVWALDMRGHGRSAGPRVVFDSIDVMLDDLDAFLALVRARSAGAPIFLYGHSIGGLISTLYTIERQSDRQSDRQPDRQSDRPRALAGLIVVSPGIALDAPPIQAAAIQLVNRLAPGLPLFPTPHERFSNQPAVVAEMDHDPLIHQPKAPARTARAAVDAIERVWAAPARLTLPLLALHGADDHVTAPSGSRDLLARASSTDKTLRIYPGFPHDLLHEPSSALVIADLIAWLDAHTGGPAVSFPSTPLTTPLRGDNAGRSVSVELDLRSEVPDEDDASSVTTAGLRTRVGFGPSQRLTYLGGVDLRAGGRAGGRAGSRADDGFTYEATAHVLGLATRTRHTLFSATAGLSLSDLRASAALSLPVELAFEASLGPTRLLARASAAWSLTGDDYADAAPFSDELSALLGLRLFPDHSYWATTVAGAGPYLAATYRDLGGTSFYGLSLGVHLWGGN